MTYTPYTFNDRYNSHNTFTTKRSTLTCSGDLGEYFNA